MLISKNIQTDVLIIGGGIAGLMAAYSVNSKKKNDVMLLLDGSGASPFVHGFSLPVYPLDSTECFIEDTLKSGQWENDEKLVSMLCKESMRIPQLFKNLDIKFDKKENGEYELLRPLGASVPRVVSAGNHTGAVLIRKLRDKLAERGNTKICSFMRALRLKTDSKGVHGALVYDTGKKQFISIEAKAVVLATGGFCGIYPFSTNSTDICGDGISMAWHAGATVKQMEFIQFEPCVAIYPPDVRGKGMITTMFYENAVLRENNGKRFMFNYSSSGEQVDKDKLALGIYREIQKGNQSPHGGVWFDATEVGIEVLEKTYPAYLKRYKDCGIDLSKEPIEVAPAPHTSLGGIEIKADCSTGVPGLFACGEVTGGIHGANRIGGNAGLEVMVFGRIAGESAGKYLSEQSEKEPYDKKTWDDWLNSLTNSLGTIKNSSGNAITTKQNELAQMRKNMEHHLTENLGVIRNEKGIRQAEDAFSEMLNILGNTALGDEPELAVQILRLLNDLTAAHLLARSALQRDKTVGCHIRADLKESN